MLDWIKTLITSLWKTLTGVKGCEGQMSRMKERFEDKISQLQNEINLIRGERLGYEMATLQQQFQNIQSDLNHVRTDQRDLTNRVNKLEAEFGRLFDRLSRIDDDLARMRDNVVRHEGRLLNQGVQITKTRSRRRQIENEQVRISEEQDQIRAEREQFRTQLNNTLATLDTMLDEIRRARASSEDRRSEPEVQRLLELLLTASRAIGGKRNSINSLLGKLAEQRSIPDNLPEPGSLAP